MIRVPWLRWLAWTAVMAATTAGLLLFRERLDKAHITLVYLLLVLAGTVGGGRLLGLALAAAGFLLFNWLFIPPYNTLAVSDPLDWLVLLAFLLVSATVAQALHRARMETHHAAERAAEVDRFAALGSEALKVGRAGESLQAVAETIRSTLRLRACAIHPAAGPPGPGGAVPDPLITWSEQHGRVAARLADGARRLTDATELPPSGLEDAVGLFLPLVAQGRTVGVLELTSDGPLQLSRAQQRFLTALTHYGTLAVERNRLEADAARIEVLREADRLKDALLASVSHDLRTPLTTIKALAHELSPADDRALVIEEEADRLNRLVANLLDLSRIKGGSFPLAIEINAVDDLVGAVLQRVSGALGRREVRVALEDGGTLMLGRFDLGQSVRILVNLVENADKYAPPGTPIDLTAGTTHGVLAIGVADRGPGVPPDQVDRIFEPFYRAPAAPPDVRGTGLGLAIARHLARLQGGDLTYAPRVGGGATFTLTLPSAPLPSDAAF